MTRIAILALLVATLPLGVVLAESPKAKNAKVTLVYQHALPNVPGKSIKGVLVEYGATKQMFTKPTEKRTEDYVTGRFG